MPTSLLHSLLARRNVFVGRHRHEGRHRYEGRNRHVGWLLLAVIVVLAASVSQHVLASAPQAMRADAPVNNYYRIAVTSSQYIGAADDAASGASSCTLRDALGIVNAGTISGTVNGCEITAVGAPAGNIYVVNLPTGGYTYTLNGAELQINANTVYVVGADRNNTIAC